MLPGSRKLQIQVILWQSVVFAVLCDEILHLIHPAILDRLRALTAGTKFVSHHLMKVRGQDDSGAAAIGSCDLLSELAGREAAGSRIQLRVDLLQGRDAVGEDCLSLPDESVAARLGRL